ncbi:hypothetical protein EXS74_02810 [Candidatus Woesearchaeota archaeon]|nr:hypothetical protein [Candidatus Woesearchaeota archaeon]
MQKLTLLFSDTELGEGNATDDFVEDELFLDTLKKNFHYGEKYPIDFIFNGDTFDFLKAPYKGKYPRHVTANISLWKLGKIYKAHTSFFKTLGECLNTNPKSRIIFIYGNHDFDIEFKLVQAQVKEYITKDKEEQKRVLFPGFEITDGLVHIEHGSQMDVFFEMDPEKMVHTSPTKVSPEPFLMTPWGFNAIYDHYLGIKEEYPLVERLTPRARTIELLPLKLKKKMIVDAFWYMAKSFFYTQFRHRKDPMRQFPLLEFKKYVHHFLEGEFEIKIDKRVKKKLQENKYKVLVIGHTHKPRILKVKGKFILNTGSWRDEYQLNEKEKCYIPKVKSYGFIIHDEHEIQEIKLLKRRSQQKPIAIKDILKYTRRRKKMKIRERIKRRFKRVSKEEKNKAEALQIKEIPHQQ